MCFAIFGQNLKIQNGRHFLGGENFLKIAKITFLRYLVGRNSKWPPFLGRGKFFENCKDYIPYFKNSYLAGRNSKWPPFLGRGKFIENCRVHSLDTLWVENFNEIALSRTVKETEANLCFAIFGKNSKIQNGRHFWGGENFLKIAKSTFLRYPVG